MPLTLSSNSGPAADAATFAAGLQAERDALLAFIGLLQAEQEILVRGDAEGLAAMANDKADKIDLLALLGAQRSRHLAAQDLSDSTDGMLAWLSRNPGFAAAVGKIWRELLKHAETARQINQSNGLLIETRLQHNRLKLSALQAAAPADSVYRADGQLRPLRNARSLSQV